MAHCYVLLNQWSLYVWLESLGWVGPLPSSEKQTPAVTDSSSFATQVILLAIKVINVIEKKKSPSGWINTLLETNRFRMVTFVKCFSHSTYEQHSTHKPLHWWRSMWSLPHFHFSQAALFFLLCCGRFDGSNWGNHISSAAGIHWAGLGLTSSCAPARSHIQALVSLFLSGSWWLWPLNSSPLGVYKVANWPILASGMSFKYPPEESY